MGTDLSKLLGKYWGSEKHFFLGAAIGASIYHFTKKSSKKFFRYGIPAIAVFCAEALIKYLDLYPEFRYMKATIDGLIFCGKLPEAVPPYSFGDIDQNLVDTVAQITGEEIFPLYSKAKNLFGRLKKK
jgi:hypothetical protein